MAYIEKNYSLGIDIGSTTIKAVLLEGGEIVYKSYKRHFANVRGELGQLFYELAGKFPGVSAAAAITGSAGVNIAGSLGVRFVQEVVAETHAVKNRYPDADVIIELGGEDAKIAFLRPVLEQRMNGTCAGGTGSFIDQMATLFKTDAAGLDKLSERAATTYTIASRCGVFAKTDLQPLLNEGASREDLAASIFQAVVNQTIAGLACGRKITGNVVFLGGPLYFLGGLRRAFIQSLGSQCENFYLPDDAQVFVAYGAALIAAEREAEGQEVRLDQLPCIFDNAQWMESDMTSMGALFASYDERRAFDERHGKHDVPHTDILSHAGPVYIGVDAGSTTTKIVAVNTDGDILFSRYKTNDGGPVGSALGMLKELYAELPEAAYIAHACVTGYGESLLVTALCADSGEIETIAHYKAAAHFCPGVDFVIDIGGQDMKCLHIKDGVIDSILLNEACSSGCGSFIQTFAENMSMTPAEFASKAIGAKNPVDLGTRCTVFMNSRVKQAQKEGATPGDISAGLSYSVVRNALYKVIKLRGPEDMGKNIVVQGGTFLNDSILRCFELISGRQVIRPSIAGVMGAYGAALLAVERGADGKSTIISPEQITVFTHDTSIETCDKCGNRCKLTISDFGGEADSENGARRRLVSGNRCERGAGGDAKKNSLPNLYEYKYKRLFAYTPLGREDARRGVIGIPRVLNIYENYPLWFTLFTRLGFRVVLSGHSSHAMFEKGLDTIPSESLCYPAKLAHGHIVDLIQKGVKTIFYPCIPYERKEDEGANNHFNCPIVTSYPEVIKNNVDALKDDGVNLICRFLPLKNRGKLAEMLEKELRPLGVPLDEIHRALGPAFEEYDRYKRDVFEKGRAALEYLSATGQKGVVLAGRPYHIDPEINHGIPQMITSLGLAVLSEDSVAAPGTAQRPIRVVDQWAYHTRLYNAAAEVIKQPALELVQLNSFGCGLDAVTTDQVQEILDAGGKPYTLLKIDEISNLGAARIRMRSLRAAMLERRTHAGSGEKSYALTRRVFTAEMKKKHTILAPQFSPVHLEMIEAVFRGAGYDMKVLSKLEPEDVETGIKYVNNDSCYPAVCVIGQMIRALQSGQYDPASTTLMITQTGGGCRATNYVALLRRALASAGFPQVPVLALSVTGIEKNPGLKLTPGVLDAAVKSIALGDLLTTVLLRNRPYEAVKGAAAALYRKWLDRLRLALERGRPLSYIKTIRAIIKDFTSLPKKDVPRKPLVGLVGEILVKFHPDANNNAVEIIENEGCEAVVPGMLPFFEYGFCSGIWRNKNLGTPYINAFVSKVGLKLLARYQRPVVSALRKAGIYMTPAPIAELSRKAAPILSCGNVCGEGWLLTAEMVELIENGVSNIICAQPFACLPNHVVGKGMIKELRRQFPESNIVPVDYDPGASEVNQLNRIKLMISNAFSKEAAQRAAEVSAVLQGAQTK